MPAPQAALLREQLAEREAELAVLQEDVPELERENSNLEAQVGGARLCTSQPLCLQSLRRRSGTSMAT